MTFLYGYHQRPLAAAGSLLMARIVHLMIRLAIPLLCFLLLGLRELPILSLDIRHIDACMYEFSPDLLLKNLFHHIYIGYF